MQRVRSSRYITIVIPEDALGLDIWGNGLDSDRCSGRDIAAGHGRRANSGTSGYAFPAGKRITPSMAR